MNDPFSELITEPEYSQVAGVSIVTLRRERRLGNGPPFIKVGRRIYYDPLDVARWLESQKVHSNAELEERRDTQRESIR